MGVLQNVIRELGKEVCRFTGGVVQDQIPRESDIVLIVFSSVYTNFHACLLEITACSCKILPKVLYWRVNTCKPAVVVSLNSPVGLRAIQRQFKSRLMRGARVL
ncbi:hypothetical protein [Butyricimonas sp.]|uniref:hypothetical protein n=1 Tax=Butyricimonas sp. TaxID=1969738 RepID=UPI0025BBB19B|nr:hypothetical protein [Butyricimonas sp.]